MWEKKHLRTKQQQAEYHKEWYKKNKKKRLKQIVLRRRKFILEAQKQCILYLKEHPCVDCGEKDPIVLEFDHRKRSSKRVLVSIIVSRGNLWSTILKEINKCDVRCANCHRRRSAKQLGYYKVNLP